MGVFTVTMVAFGCAMKSQNTFIAARCTARPPTVIYNRSPYRHPSQDRGSPMLGWVTWVMRLTYDTMLRGVPGTGTRDGGLSGALLKVNLDGIVLLRFHHLCLRVCTLACFLYLVVVLPVYATAQCSRIGGDRDSPQCGEEYYNLTDYERLTLTNIPTLDTSGDVYGGDLARLYAVVFVTWIVTYYALRELKLEWGDVLAMRRVYYLEADHWKDRNEELEHTLLRVEREKFQRRASGQHNSAQNKEEDESYLTDRKPWIPHPEQRDTVPNVELYSVLVGGLPSLPTEVVDQEEVEAVFSRKQSIDWQLSVTTAFFDHSVPNQPGYSSSIAAVTILPSAEHLGEAWNQWYRVAGKLRRLRFIRKEINSRKRLAALENGRNPLSDIEEGGGNNAVHQEQFPPPSTQMPVELRKQQVYAQSPEKKEYYQEVLGSTDDLQVESRLLFGLGFGPEQTASYSREFALGAANLAPYGWHEERVYGASLEELLRMEKKAVEQVHEANAALREAQERIAEDDSKDDSDDDVSQEGELDEIIHNGTIENGNAQNDGYQRSYRVSKAAASTRSFDEEKGNSGDFGGSPPRPKTIERRQTSSASKKSNRSGYDTTGTPSKYDTDDEESFFDESSSGSSYRMELHESDRDIEEGSNPRRRVTRSKSIDSTRSGISNESGESTTKRSIGRSSFIRGLVRSSSNKSLDGLGREKRKAAKADISSAQLPSDLGLEAGLWKEHRASMHGGSNHGLKNRSNTPSRRGKSALGASMHGIHGAQFSGGKKRSVPKRTKSSDDIDIFGIEETSTSPVSKAKPLITMKRSLSCDNVDLLTDEMGTSGHSNTQGQADSIWSRLEKDKERKQRLRDRLSNMQSSSSALAQSGASSIDTAPSPPTNDGEEPLRCPQRVREYRSDVGPRESRRNDATDMAAAAGVELRTQPRNNSSRAAPEALSVPIPQTHPPKMKSLHEDMPDDDDSVDMNALGATAQVYGYNVEHLGASQRSFSSHQVEDNLRIALDFEAKAGLRHRDVGGENEETEHNIDAEDKWTRVMAIVQEASRDKNVNDEAKQRMISSGIWRVPTCRGILHTIRIKFFAAWAIFKLRMKPPEIVDDLVRDSSYAIVTFTSRQAAVAARHCLADSRGHDRWVTVAEIPSPPLADAPVCNMSSFRGCVRPVTLSISDKQKIIRHSL